MMNKPPFDPENKPPFTSAIVVDNSPIEFILAGPRGRGEGILVRTRNARLDLIGSCLDGKEERLTRSSLYSPLSLLGVNYLPEVSVIRSHPIPVKQITDDERSGTFAFSWLGMSSLGDQEVLRTEFDRRVADIQNAIAKGDKEQVEWSLGPFVALCMKTDRKHRLYRNVIRSIFILLITGYLIFWFWIIK
jgi:hypothetical protein